MILLLLKTMNTLTLKHREKLELLMFAAGATCLLCAAAPAGPTWAGGELGSHGHIIGGVSSPVAVVARAGS